MGESEKEVQQTERVVLSHLRICRSLELVGSEEWTCCRRVTIACSSSWSTASWDFPPLDMDNLHVPIPVALAAVPT